MRNKIISFLLFTSYLLANDAFNSEIVVALSKREPFLPIEVCCKDPELKEVLTFDLDNNGVTKIADKTPTLTVEVEICDQNMSAFLISHRTQEKTPIGTFSLCGSLVSDRRLMHQIADNVHEAISGKKGIASTQIFYALQFPDGEGYKSEIWSADYDGKNARQITDEKSYCITPTLFPKQGGFTKNKYLYVNYKLGQPKIYISALNKQRGKPFISLRGNQLLPDVAKTGNAIAFISDASGRADLFLQYLDPDQGLIGKPLQLYSLPGSVQASPTFRPDGKKLAFVSDQEGTPRIYLITIPPPGKWMRPVPTCITRKYRQNTCPSWSPDGTKLAYSAMISGVRQIMIYDFITQEESQLTTGKSHKENPTWGPTSLHLIYNTVDPSSSELFLINLKQKKMIKISEGPGKKHYPKWGL